MSRSPLPQNWLKYGDLLLDFENADNWVPITANVTKEANTSQYQQGSQSLKVTTLTSSWSNMIKYTYTTPLSLATKGKGIFVLWVYPHESITSISQIDLRISSNTTNNQYLNNSLTTISSKCVANQWQPIIFQPEASTAVGGITWDTILANGIKEVMICVYPTTGTPVISFDNLRIYSEGIPTINLMFDDGHESVMSKAYGVMSDYGLRGTVYVIPNLVGTAGAVTEANLETLHDAGWALANHTYNHPNLTTLSQAQQEDQFISCKNWLDTRGYTRASGHVAYPYGQNNTDTLAAMAATGMLTGRATTTGFLSVPYSYKYQLVCRDATRGIALSTVLSWIREAIATKRGLNILFHRIVETFTEPAVDTEWLLSNFISVVRELAVCGCRVVTIDEWYQGLTDPRYQATNLSRNVVV